MYFLKMTKNTPFYASPKKLYLALLHVIYAKVLGVIVEIARMPVFMPISICFKGF